MRTPPRTLWLAVLCAALGYPAALAQTMPRIEPATTQWRVEPRLTNRKEAENLSAAVCAADGTCLLVSDEISDQGRWVRFARIEGTRLLPGRTLDLLPSGFDETDAEAADVAGGMFYVVGSHGVTKNDGGYQRSRFFLYRFPIDARQPSQVQRTNRLEALIAAVDKLEPHACTQAKAARRECPRLQQGGVNIEGMAVRDGRVFLGLRGPLLADAAVVLEVDADALFSDLPTTARRHTLRLGRGVGIRDLVRVSGGFLVLGGPSDPDDDSGAAPVFLWAGDATEPRPLGTLRALPGRDHKPEALLVLREDAAAWRVLVL